jgi:hypothetical protein
MTGTRHRVSLQSGQYACVSAWTPPIAEVKFIRVEHDALIIGLRLPSGLDVLAPSSLILNNDNDQLPLDRVVGTDGGITVFRSATGVPPESVVFNPGRNTGAPEHTPSLNIVGQEFEFRQWWTQEAYDAVADTARQWSRRAAPTPEKHDHCLLDWTTIADDDGTFGWYSDGSWICVDCYQRYFVEDRLGIRGSA